MSALLDGRTALVTGASSGIGRETARALCRLGATVVMAVRDAGRGEEARADVERTTGSRHLEVALCDFSSPSRVRSFAAAFRERHPALHVLVLNAGIWSARRRLSAEGVELTWATNVLGYFLTADLLLPALRAGAPSRVVVVASELARNLDLDDPQFERRPYDGLEAYAQSKQANRMWTWALARRLEGSGVTANAMHPGGVDTGIFRKGGSVKGALAGLSMKIVGKSPAEGADTVVWLASAPELEGVSGRYWIDRQEHPCRFHHQAEEERLFELCQRMTR
ncbi:MAG TPA: SDR family oxidoreductase [Vicinamibacteria bacterium]